jgi:hypothetical protein
MNTGTNSEVFRLKAGHRTGSCVIAPVGGNLFARNSQAGRLCHFVTLALRGRLAYRAQSNGSNAILRDCAFWKSTVTVGPYNL